MKSGPRGRAEGTWAPTVWCPPYCPGTLPWLPGSFRSPAKPFIQKAFVATGHLLGAPGRQHPAETRLLVAWWNPAELCGRNEVSGYSSQASLSPSWGHQWKAAEWSAALAVSFLGFPVVETVLDREPNHSQETHEWSPAVETKAQKRSLDLRREQCDGLCIVENMLWDTVKNPQESSC